MDITKRRSNIKNGIIVGADLSQEWILPWWWHHYKKFNNFPVTFIDFGMSSLAKAWCKKRGKVVRLALADIFVKEKDEIDASYAQLWEGTYGKEFWAQRAGWFKKPFACLLSPYQRTIWIDLDCEVRGSLQGLFLMADHPSGVALARDIQESRDGSRDENRGYNSGVIVFKQGTALIEKWARESITSNHLYAGDQDILTKLIVEEQLSIQELGDIYNWSRCYGESSDAVIYHWHGRHGKTVIASQLPKVNA